MTSGQNVTVANGQEDEMSQQTDSVDGNVAWSILGGRIVKAPLKTPPHCRKNAKK
jgi:hypothetical protein